MFHEKDVVKHWFWNFTMCHFWRSKEFKETPGTFSKENNVYFLQDILQFNFRQNSLRLELNFILVLPLRIFLKKFDSPSSKDEKHQNTIKTTVETQYHWPTRCLLLKGCQNISCFTLNSNDHSKIIFFDSNSCFLKLFPWVYFVKADRCSNTHKTDSKWRMNEFIKGSHNIHQDKHWKYTCKLFICRLAILRFWIWMVSPPLLTQSGLRLR